MTSIIGAGGGGGKGGGGSKHVATEDADTLQSVQYAKVIDLLSEGPIGGLVAGLQSVYLDGVPIQNSDGSVNFSGVTLVERTGTQEQTYIPGFDEVANEIGVNVRVRADLPATRLLSGSTLDAVRVTLNVPALTYQDLSNGDTHGTSVAIAIDVNANNGGWRQMVTDTISGKCTSPYKRAYRIALPAPGPWQVRVRRLTADSTQSNLNNQTWWDSYAEVVEQKLRYPLSAHVGIQVDARQFNSIPARAYEIKGLLIRIPSNYDPISRSYSGLWNGSFKLAWSDNPAWVFFDLLTESRYGLGSYLDAALIDQWALYDIARYCDELVPDGFGGTEPRFTCNLYLQAQEEAWKVLANLASIFRGMLFWAGGQIVPVADRPGDAVALFCEANVVDGNFTYSGASRQTRYNVALVTWNDPADGYKQKVEYVEDADSIATLGVLQTEVVAFGCTSRGQAHRAGKWLIYTSQLETESVAFSTGLEGCAVAPGDIIQIADPARAGERRGGRIVAATTTSVTLDAAVTLVAGQSYTLAVLLPTGALETRAVTSAAGSSATLSVAAYSAAPQANAPWLLANAAVEPQTFRVLSVADKDGLEIEIRAIAHNPSKFGHIEQGLALQVPSISSLSLSPGAPTNLSVSESIYLINANTAASRATLSWTAPANCSRFVATARCGNEPPLVVETTSSSADFQPAPVGDWVFTVVAVNVLGASGPIASISQTLLGTSLPPPCFDYFQVGIQDDGTRQFTWGWTTTAKPVDLKGAKLRFRQGAGWTWDDMYHLDTDDGFFPASPHETGLLLAGEYTFACKSIDLQGQESDTALYIEAALSDPRLGDAYAGEYAEEMGWPGETSNLDAAPNPASAWNMLTASDSTTWADLDVLGSGTWADWLSWVPNPATSASYTHTVQDMGTVLTFRPGAQVRAVGSYTIEERHGNTAAPDSSWSLWVPATDSITARYVQMRITLNSGSGELIQIESFYCYANAPVITEFINDLVPGTLSGTKRIGVGDIRVPLTNAYAFIRVCIPTLQSIPAGHSWTTTIVDKDPAQGPRLQFYRDGVLADPPSIDVYIRGIKA
jgi:predicted phage tail protein